MILEDIEDQLIEENPQAVFLDGLDTAVIGIARRMGLSVVAYSEEKIIDILIKQDKMSISVAREFFENNIANAWMGEGTPIIVSLM